MNILQRLKLKALNKKLASMAKGRASNAVSDEQSEKEIAMYFEAAKLYEKFRFSKQCPHAAIYALENYRAAAELDSTRAIYAVGERLMEQGKVWLTIKASHLGQAVHETYAKNVFDEAFSYLEKANSQGYAFAKRLIGLAFVNGWGVEVDMDKGGKMIVDSISQENAWDRATEIFKELGLNKPEVFSAIMAMKGK